jgi:hypothetical protein
MPTDLLCSTFAGCGKLILLRMWIRTLGMGCNMLHGWYSHSSFWTHSSIVYTWIPKGEHHLHSQWKCHCPLLLSTCQKFCCDMRRQVGGYLECSIVMTMLEFFKRRKVEPQFATSPQICLSFSCRCERRSSCLCYTSSILLWRMLEMCIPRSSLRTSFQHSAVFLKRYYIFWLFGGLFNPSLKILTFSICV